RDDHVIIRVIDGYFRSAPLVKRGHASVIIGDPKWTCGVEGNPPGVLQVHVRKAGRRNRLVVGHQVGGQVKVGPDRRGGQTQGHQTKEVNQVAKASHWPDLS